MHRLLGTSRRPTRGCDYVSAGTSDKENSRSLVQANKLEQGSNHKRDMLSAAMNSDLLIRTRWTRRNVIM